LVGVRVVNDSGATMSSLTRSIPMPEPVPVPPHLTEENRIRVRAFIGLMQEHNRTTVELRDDASALVVYKFSNEQFISRMASTGDLINTTSKRVVEELQKTMFIEFGVLLDRHLDAFAKGTILPVLQNQTEVSEKILAGIRAIEQRATEAQFNSWMHAAKKFAASFRSIVPGLLAIAVMAVAQRRAGNVEWFSSVCVSCAWVVGAWGLVGWLLSSCSDVMCDIATVVVYCLVLFTQGLTWANLVRAYRAGNVKKAAKEQVIDANLYQLERETAESADYVAELKAIDQKRGVRNSTSDSKYPGQPSRMADASPSRAACAEGVQAPGEWYHQHNLRRGLAKISAIDYSTKPA